MCNLVDRFLLLFIHLFYALHHFIDVEARRLFFADLQVGRFKRLKNKKIKQLFGENNAQYKRKKKI
jgi:hypothetical protein